MKLALFADVHANLEALEACLAHADESGAERYAFLGDLVGYGADPGPVLDLVAACIARGALAVKGNHDVAVLDGNVAAMNRAAAAAVVWTRDRITPGQRALLAGLPLVVREGEAVFVHGSPDAPEQFIYVSDPLRAARALAAASARYVFAGHVHEPVLYYTGAADRPMPFRPVPGVVLRVPPHRSWLAIVGSAGQPRDGNPAACYALADLERSELTFHRVPYDCRTAAQKVRRAGLPEVLARRLERGE
jgi:diadenosine tetraphosphatase ApaH/serine/threonine PP2A family protein phosphatase